MTIVTKGMGKIMKSKMKKAFVDKPTFPGPNAINILNRELKKNIESQDLVDLILFQALQECVKANLVKVLLN